MITLHINENNGHRCTIDAATALGCLTIAVNRYGTILSSIHARIGAENIVVIQFSNGTTGYYATDRPAPTAES